MGTTESVADPLRLDIINEANEYIFLLRKKTEQIVE